MTPRPVLLAALAWQTASLVNIGSPADPVHMRYERAVRLPSGPLAGGVVCTVLDAAVFAHAALPGAADLRLFRADPGTPGGAEVPYLLTESGPEPVDAAAVRPSRIHRTDRDLHFDLTMPPRAFSELRLQMDTRGFDRDFVGTALVSAEGASKVPGKGFGERTSLGNFGIFDLHREGLGRWTTLLLAESTAPVLHLTLALRTPAGQPIADLPPTLVESVDVPPSRERQTVYTPVATTTFFAGRGDATVGTLHVPAHVPVEELQVVPAPGPGPNFARAVVVTARTDDDPFNEPEILDAGTLQRTRIPSGDPRLNPIDVEERNFPSTLGATLAHPATIEIAVANGAGPALRLASATLEMRERRLCFNPAFNAAFGAAQGATYTLRYGDPALLAPLYADPPETAASARTAVLGPETRNPQWIHRRDRRPFFDRHPELFWIVVLLCSGTMGGTALQFVQHRGEDAGD